MEQDNSEKESLPITKYDDMFEGATDRIIYGAIPLCPHCGEWSYYTTTEEEERGYSVCPFCWGKMYMPKENKNICKYCKHSKTLFKGRVIYAKKTIQNIRLGSITTVAKCLKWWRNKYGI